jgi:superfamily II DNA helicase RecQ
MGRFGVHITRQSLDDPVVKTKLITGDFKYVFGHPEDILPPEALECLSNAMAHFDNMCVVVDGAHCIVEWGANFRPYNRLIANLRTTSPHLHMIAMIATASPTAQKYIIKLLAMRKPAILNCTPVLNKNVKLVVRRRISSTGTVPRYMCPCVGRLSSTSPGAFCGRVRSRIRTTLGCNRQ